MKKSELVTIIREAMRKELKTSLRVIIKEEIKNALKNNIKKEVIKEKSESVDTFKKNITNTIDLEKETNAYSKKGKLNLILNETAKLMTEEDLANFGTENSEESNLPGMEKSVLNTSNQPEHINKVLNKNYSQFLKKMDEKKSKQFRP
ncbi:MAG: hypothetical protein ISS28_04775 [Candidatus Cloacimonetes bacterium]|nr:hypothetical protein [Candidatus Cloacimonadota bacterium]